MKKILLVILLLGLLSCSKNEQASIQVRVQNETNVILDSVRLIYDISNYNYGTVDVNNATGYHAYQTLPTAATANVFINGQEVVVGRLFPPNSYPYPVLNNGNYTLKIFTDTTLSSGFNAEFIKE